MDVVTQKGPDNHCFNKPGLISRTLIESLAGGHSQRRVWKTRKQVNRIYPYGRRMKKVKEEQTSLDFQREYQRMSTITMSKLESENG